jgi:phage/plasmid-associated DNA primase
LKVLAEAAIENEDYLVNEEMIMMKGNSQIEGLEEAHSMKLQEVKQEEILPSSDSEAENEDNFFEREMNRLDEELSYLNKKKNDDSNDDSQQSPSRQQMAEELDKDDIEKQYLNRATMESPNSH